IWLTNDVTILPNAAPMTTPIAMSITLPLSANSLNSFSMACDAPADWIDLRSHYGNEVEFYLQALLSRSGGTSAAEARPRIRRQECCRSYTTSIFLNSTSGFAIGAP